MEESFEKDTDFSVNPYTPPVSRPTAIVDPFNGRARRIATAWERMRLKYNLILLLPGLIILIVYIAGNGMPVAIALIGAVMTALAANFCYFLGAVSELCVCALFHRSEHPDYRRTAYIAGVALSLVFFAMAFIPAVLVVFE